MCHASFAHRDSSYVTLASNTCSYILVLQHWAIYFIVALECLL